MTRRGTVFLGAENVTERKRSGKSPRKLRPGECPSVGRFEEPSRRGGMWRFTQTCTRRAPHEGLHDNGGTGEDLLTWEGP